MHNLIAIAGETQNNGSKGAGKDLTAKLIQRQLLIKEVERGERNFYTIPHIEPLSKDNYEVLGCKWKVKRFADKPKEVYCSIYNISRWELEDREKKELHREGLIAIAEKLRELDPQFWSKALFNQWNKYTDQWIISDLRFQHTEIPFIKKEGGLVIKVVNKRVPNTSLHVSERGIDGSFSFDWILYNDSSIQRLEAQVQEMMDHFKLHY